MCPNLVDNSITIFVCFFAFSILRSLATKQSKIIENSKMSFVYLFFFFLSCSLWSHIRNVFPLFFLGHENSTVRFSMSCNLSVCVESMTIVVDGVSHIMENEMEFNLSSIQNFTFDASTPHSFLFSQFFGFSIEHKVITDVFV